MEKTIFATKILLVYFINASYIYINACYVSPGDTLQGKLSTEMSGKRSKKMCLNQWVNFNILNYILTSPCNTKRLLHISKHFIFCKNNVRKCLKYRCKMFTKVYKCLLLQGLFFSLLFCLRARAFNLGKFWTRNKPFILSGLNKRLLLQGSLFLLFKTTMTISWYQ